MNLGAFFNIGNLEPIAKANGIDVPCLRSYWRMKNKKKLTNDDISEMCRDITNVAFELTEYCPPPLWCKNEGK